MSTNRHVTKHPDGWQVKKEGAKRASTVLPTQKDAENWAKDSARKSGGGEVVIHRPDGRIRDKDTIPPANDPFPPKDKVH